MITQHRIAQIASRDGVDATVVERDYILAHVVAQLPWLDLPGTGEMIFKGGTSLRLIHTDGYRYSADLDFSLLGCSPENAYSALARALERAKVHAELPMLELTSETKPRVRYVGPLRARPRDIKLDLTADEYVSEFVRKPIRPAWEDLPERAPLTVYSLDEIAAEKLRCVIQRVQCRDLFDLHELAEHLGVDLAHVRPVFEAKARAQSIDASLFTERFEQRMPAYRERWLEEMDEHVIGEPPPFREVERAIRRRLRAAGLLSS